MNAIAKSLAHQLFETLRIDISKDDQDVNFMGLLAVDGNKVRLRIRSNSYKFQCHAVAEIWSPTLLKWNEVATIPHGAMVTPAGLTYNSGRPGSSFAIWSDPSHFKADADALLQQVALILL